MFVWRRKVRSTIPNTVMQLKHHEDSSEPWKYLIWNKSQRKLNLLLFVGKRKGRSTIPNKTVMQNSSIMKILFLILDLKQKPTSFKQLLFLFVIKYYNLLQTGTNFPEFLQNSWQIDYFHTTPCSNVVQHESVLKHALSIKNNWSSNSRCFWWTWCCQQFIFIFPTKAARLVVSGSGFALNQSSTFQSHI